MEKEKNHTNSGLIENLKTSQDSLQEQNAMLKRDIKARETELEQARGKYSKLK